MEQNLRHLPPTRRHYPLRQIPYADRIVIAQVYSYLLHSLPHSRDLVVPILRISLPARQRNMPRPFVPNPRRSLDEQQLGISMLYPILLKESIQYVLECKLVGPVGSCRRSSPLLCGTVRV